MRQIKFRIWAETDDGMEMIYLGKSECDNGLWFDAPKHLDKYEALMQYIGLKDKNGKEIYESDLLIDNDGSICQVEYDNGAWWFVNPFVIGNRNDYNFLKNNPYKDYWSDMEVAGNIYENKNLLNTK